MSQFLFSKPHPPFPRPRTHNVRNLLLVCVKYGCRSTGDPPPLTGPRIVLPGEVKDRAFFCYPLNNPAPSPSSSSFSSSLTSSSCSLSLPLFLSLHLLLLSSNLPLSLPLSFHLSLLLSLPVERKNTFFIIFRYLLCCIPMTSEH
jgi:hypothetical protein